MRLAVAALLALAALAEVRGAQACGCRAASEFCKTSGHNETVCDEMFALCKAYMTLCTCQDLAETKAAYQACSGIEYETATNATVAPTPAPSETVAPSETAAPSETVAPMLRGGV